MNVYIFEDLYNYFSLNFLENDISFELYLNTLLNDLMNDDLNKKMRNENKLLSSHSSISQSNSIIIYSRSQSNSFVYPLTKFENEIVSKLCTITNWTDKRISFFKNLGFIESNSYFIWEDTCFYRYIDNGKSFYVINMCYIHELTKGFNTLIKEI